MIAVIVELLHGTIRSAGHEDSALTGEATMEWPPSPARLIRALVAGDGTRENCRVTSGVDALKRLLEPPVILAVPTGDLAMTLLEPRYVVADANKKHSSVQQYPARTATLVRPGVRLSPSVPVIVYMWPSLSLGEQEFAELTARAARVPYLGCSDSPVRLRVVQQRSDDWAQLGVWHPQQGGDTDLPVPFEGLIDQLDASYDAWTSGPHRRSWSPELLASYASPGTAGLQSRDSSGVALWTRFSRPIAGRRVLAVADSLRGALLEKATELVGSREQVPGGLHGHGLPAGSEHVRFLPLPNVGFKHSDGRIHGACVWFPSDTDAEVIALARQAVYGVNRLVVPSLFDVQVSMFDGTRTPWSSNPRRWTGSSDCWVSVFPVIFERRLKRGLTLRDLRDWCRFADLPEPVDFMESEVPLLKGAPRLSPSEVFRGQEKRPFRYLRIKFACPVQGPVAIGRGRHFGLGLMVPDVGGDPSA